MRKIYAFAVLSIPLILPLFLATLPARAFEVIPLPVQPLVQAASPRITDSVASQRVVALITRIDHEKGANPAIGLFIGRHEATFDPNAVGDKDFVCNLKGSPLYGQISPSYGLAQINRCAHPDISVQQALDPVF